MTRMMQITELEVWKASLEMAKASFDLSDKFPQNETFGLAYQLKRACVLLSSNISAAASRKQGKESLKHLYRARDVIYEIETVYYFCERLGYITESELNEFVDQLTTCKRLLFGFIKYYKRTIVGNNRGSRPQKEDDFEVEEEY